MLHNGYSLILKIITHTSRLLGARGFRFMTSASGGSCASDMPGASSHARSSSSSSRVDQIL
jgi:hypothetical protein